MKKIVITFVLVILAVSPLHAEDSDQPTPNTPPSPPDAMALWNKWVDKHPQLKAEADSNQDGFVDKQEKADWLRKKAEVNGDKSNRPVVNNPPDAAKALQKFKEKHPPKPEADSNKNIEPKRKK